MRFLSPFRVPDKGFIAVSTRFFVVVLGILVSSAKGLMAQPAEPAGCLCRRLA